MKEDKRLKRKVRNSYLVSTLSIALVLFLLGSVGYLMLAAHQLATTLQGSMMVMVELSRESTATEREALLEALQQEPLAILGAVGNHFRRLGTARTLLDHGRNASDMAKLCGLPDYPARKLMDAARRLRHEFCAKAVE